MFKVNNNIGGVLVSLLLTLNIFHTSSNVFIVNFEQVNTGWVRVNIIYFHDFMATRTLIGFLYWKMYLKHFSGELSSTALEIIFKVQHCT